VAQSLIGYVEVAQPIQTIVNRLIGQTPLSGLCAEDGFDPSSPQSAQTLAAAWLIVLAGHEHARYGEAQTLLEGDDSAVASFFLAMADRILEETADASTSTQTALQRAADWCTDSSTTWDAEAQQTIWGAIFPQGAACLADPDQVVDSLRTARTVKIDHLNPKPLTDPLKQLLVTSNVLLTIPADPDPAHWPYDDDLSGRLHQVCDEPQLYWFDHPIPLDVSKAANEVLYGLRGLNDAVAFEKRTGRAESDLRLRCVLSVSVTHEGLSHLAVECLNQMLADSEPNEHLDVYVFPESLSDAIIDRVIKPAASRWGSPSAADVDALRRVFGVDGPYGRHYSFLKAISALWQVCADDQIQATFKIDLDQIFPQEQLVEQGGGSAFDHFRSPLWGAKGTDAEGRSVELGMFAGALVNEKDIGDGLFTPDVPRPTTIPAGEATVFYNKLPMALSTEAEMMTRYDGQPVDGVTAALQRIHVTGGTNGILVDALRRHRPFTPSFIGRAEDQSYLLSVLFASEQPLRYVHASGLVMRHDKEAFAAGAIEAAKTGRFIGDLVRTLYFSAYRDALPWSVDQTQEQIDPFTGCFASQVPVSIVCLRLAMHAADLFAHGDDQEGAELIQLGVEQLGPLISNLADPAYMKSELATERAGWGLYYDSLDYIESALSQGEAEALALQKDAMAVLDAARIGNR
jgi:hypothetical protein